MQTCTVSVHGTNLFSVVYLLCFDRSYSGIRHVKCLRAHCLCSFPLLKKKKKSNGTKWMTALNSQHLSKPVWLIKDALYTVRCSAVVQWRRLTEAYHRYSRNISTSRPTSTKDERQREEEKRNMTFDLWLFLNNFPLFS